MRSDWLDDDNFKHVLAALMPKNRLALEVSRATGLRISDVLNLRTDKLAQRMTVRELKTGKTRRVYFPLELYNRMLIESGKLWVFEGRTDYKKHRSRQAVYKDIKRAAKLFRASGVVQRGQNVTPHTARKNYAVEVFDKTGDMQAVAAALNHNENGLAVTQIYATADVLTQKRLSARKGKNKRS